MFDGFKAFLMRGNVIDLAVGVIIGGAFGKIVSALVEGVFNPIILKILMAVVGTDKPDYSAIDAYFGGLKVGGLIGAIIEFLLIAGATYFFIVKPFNNVAAKLAPPAPPPSPSEVALVEMRDMMKAQMGK